MGGTNPQKSVQRQQLSEMAAASPQSPHLLAEVRRRLGPQSGTVSVPLIFPLGVEALGHVGATDEG